MGDLEYGDFDRISAEDEKIVLLALVETFVSRAWCFRQPCDGQTLLTFPSYYRRERPSQRTVPGACVSYRFEGAVDAIYSTLVVKLHYSLSFETETLWKDAADFKTIPGSKLGLQLCREGLGTFRLDAFFAPDIDPVSQILFLRYLHDHLSASGENIVRLRHYSCGNKACSRFGVHLMDREIIDKESSPNATGRVFCVACGTPIELIDSIERQFNSGKIKAQSLEMSENARIKIDSQSREMLAVGHVTTIVAEASHIFRPVTVSDYGIDGEIEFRDYHGNPSGKKLYVQLKSGDSHLNRRRKDQIEIFQIKKEWWAKYWLKQAFTVMLVIRTSDGSIRWMDVTNYLKDKMARGITVKQIEFQGEELNTASLTRWRDKLLGMTETDR